MCEPAPKRSRTAIVEGMALADSADMFDSQGEDNIQELDSNNAKNWSGVPLASLPRLQPHGSSPPPPPPVPGPSHTVAVKLPLQVDIALEVCWWIYLKIRLNLRTQLPSLHLTRPRHEMCGTEIMCGFLGAKTTSTLRSRRAGRFWPAGRFSPPQSSSLKPDLSQVALGHFCPHLKSDRLQQKAWTSNTILQHKI